MKKPKNSLAELSEQHAALCRDLADKAAETGRVQLDLYWQTLLARFGPILRERGRVATFNARESRANFQKFLDTLDEAQVRVTEIIFDPVRSDFHVFAEVV